MLRQEKVSTIEEIMMLDIKWVGGEDEELTT